MSAGETQQPFHYSIALSAILGPVGLFFAYRARLISAVWLFGMFVFWLSFMLLVLAANEREFHPYLYMLVNMTLAIPIFGAMPPKVGESLKKTAAVALKLFSLVCLVFLIGEFLPVFSFLLDTGLSQYKVQNPRATLLYSNMLTFISFILAISYIIGAFCFLFLRNKRV